MMKRLMIAAGLAVALCGVTNGMYSCSLYGEPCAPRITWHKSDQTNDLKLVGISTWDRTTTERYFSGLNARSLCSDLNVEIWYN